MIVCIYIVGKKLASSMEGAKFGSPNRRVRRSHQNIIFFWSTPTDSFTLIGFACQLAYSGTCT
jgi:hypothetical protein